MGTKKDENLVKVSWEMGFFYKINQYDIRKLSERIKETKNKELIEFYSDIEKRFESFTISTPPVIEELSPCDT
ncbi:hypothetical protein COY27_03080 [Candidatus Woesearchaeota archaeon CG_4_10_14_0_2_um_filter_33_13]|nr:MAG: hypothetical protein COY27_03080 [Candidatus Woesearchaeota archaeon CG_4_10_14_0_2_um_filter_33_13]